MNFRPWPAATLLAWLACAAGAQAACPNGSSFDSNLGFCADASNAYGPFTQAMTGQCSTLGGGPACTDTKPYVVGSTTVQLPRWSKAFTQGLRGTGACPNGSVPDPAYGNRCSETVGGVKSVYGPFADSLIAQCVAAAGGPACYTNRWNAGFYAGLTSAGTAKNKFGAWLFLISNTGMTHAQLADKLKSVGVKRIFIKIADGANSCNWFPDACSKTTTDIYKARGIEPWAWSYNYPGNEAAQANALKQAASFGYQGYVLDLEKEFDGTSTALENLLKAFSSAQAQARAAGTIQGDWYLTATTWGNPKDRGMRVDIIDKYVDAHMPQTYLDVWGPSYVAETKRWIETGNCEYRALGAKKPIWHIASNEKAFTSAAQQNEFFKIAGPHASLWVVPGAEVPLSQWNTMAAMNWQQTSWDTSTACSAGNYQLASSPPPNPMPVATSCPDGASFDTALGFCADTANAYGPFPAAMVSECQRLGGGSTCAEQQPLPYQGNTVTVAAARWAKAFTKSLRGTAACPRGSSAGDARFDGQCVEGTAPSGNPLNVFGPFPPTLTTSCQSKGGGLACLQQRWSGDFYLQLKGLSSTPVTFPYYNQNANQQEGWRACNITSLAMVLDFYKITDPARLGMRTPDYLYKTYGISGAPATMANIFNAEAIKAGSALRDQWTSAGSIGQLRSLVGSGKPVVIHGWFTGSGHIVEVVGWDGANYIVNDPYGVWDGVPYSKNYDTTRSGKGVKYPAAKFEAVITDDGTGADLLMHVFK
ncbi:MAG: C39 family peptidase [Inhella sp.]